MRYGIVGSRGFSNLPLVSEFVLGLDPDDSIVSGGARGVDITAEDTARERGLDTVVFRVLDRHDGYFNIERWLYKHLAPPEGPLRIGRDGKPLDGTTAAGAFRSFPAAAFTRNGYIVEFADEVVAFWDGHSPGTKDSIARARELGNLGSIIRG